jgi:hypothetical protein
VVGRGASWNIGADQIGGRAGGSVCLGSGHSVVTPGLLFFPDNIHHLSKGNTGVSVCPNCSAFYIGLTLITTLPRAWPVST